jgi:epoxyqueuosine reductase
MVSAGDIKAYALSIGFTHVGIAPAVILEKEAALLDEWCARGYDASMGWMKKRREERRNIQSVLAGTRSVIVLTLNYAAEPDAQCGIGALKISQYARGRDYHEVLGERLEQLQKWILSRAPDAACRYYVDTGPVLEKAWAVRAGLGWLGKHTNVITADHGSFVFLGVLLTTLELDPDAPATDHCGSCTRCIDACPTAAIVEPYLLDSRRCISYLTIEHRDELPADLAGKFGTWIFGCDICQDVCPWNHRFAQPSADGAWKESGWPGSLSVETLKEMDSTQFDAVFRHSPIRRARWGGFLRNVKNALMNLTGMGNDPRVPERASHEKETGVQ